MNIKRKNLFIKSESVRKENESPINLANSVPNTLSSTSCWFISKWFFGLCKHIHIFFLYCSHTCNTTFIVPCVEYWHERSHLHAHITMYGISNLYANVACQLFLFIRYIFPNHLYLWCQNTYFVNLFDEYNDYVTNAKMICHTEHRLRNMFMNI